MRRLSKLSLVLSTLLVPSLHAADTETVTWGDIVPTAQTDSDTLAAATPAAPLPDAPQSDLSVLTETPDATTAATPEAVPAATADTTLDTAGTTPDDAQTYSSEVTPAVDDVKTDSSPILDNLANSAVENLTFAQMGMPSGILLGGGQTQGGVSFTLPESEVVTTAQLSLNVHVTPEMVARHSSLQLMLNGQPLGTLPLTQGEKDILHFQLDIPSALMVAVNNLSFKINDGDMLQCLRDDAKKYQVTVLPTSSFSFASQQLNVSSDLGMFPQPFIDPMSMNAAKLSISFPAKFSADTLSAAATVSSWFGIQADYRGLKINAMRDRLPEKHGIVIGHPGEQVGGLTLPQSDKPLLQIVDNPINPSFKLLLLVGKDEAALRAVAWRLTRGNFTTSTASLAVTPGPIPVSKPYDAPRWIPTDRPVQVKELMRKNQDSIVRGIWHDPLRVSFRAAPDLYLWDGETIPLTINYRFPSERWIDEDKSNLSVTLNDTFLNNLPMNKQGVIESIWHKLGGDTRQEKFTIPLEPYLIYGDNQLSLYFNVSPKSDTPCNVLQSNNIKSQLIGNSSIDLSHTQHFAMLPNLSYFVGASFPFTRLADYSQTALVLPAAPSEMQVTTLMNLAVRSGNSTGTPLANNKVIMGIPSKGPELELLKHHDVLAVTTLDQTPFNQQLFADSPYKAHDNTLGVRVPSLWQKIVRGLKGDWETQSLQADRYLSSNNGWRGFVSFRSAWDNGRIVVTAIGSNDGQLQKLMGDLESSKINAGIRGDTAIITDENGVQTFRVSTQFPGGQMPWYMVAIWYANQHSGLLAAFGLLAASLFGVILTKGLIRHSHKRLTGTD